MNLRIDQRAVGAMATAILLVAGQLIFWPEGDSEITASPAGIFLNGQPGAAIVMLALALAAASCGARFLAAIGLLAVVALSAMALRTVVYSGSEGLSAVLSAVPVLACLMVSAGALLQLRSRTDSLRFAVLALYIGAGSAAAVALVSMALLAGVARSESAALIHLIGSGALALGWIDAWIARYNKPEVDANGSRASIAFAGFCAAVTSWWIVSASVGAGEVQRLSWQIVFPLIAFWVTFSLFSAIAGKVRVSRLSIRQQELLGAVEKQLRVLQEHESQMHLATHRYQQLFDGVPAPVILTSPAGETLAANEPMLKFLGVDSVEDLKGRNFSSFYTNPSHREALLRDWQDSDEDEHSGEIEMRRADGEHRSVLYTLRMIRDEAGAVAQIQGTITDVTELRRADAERRRLESHLRLSQKLESVGRLAAGIAHEINTPMQYIGDNVYFLKQAYESIRDLRGRQKAVLNDPEITTVRDLLEEFEDIDDELDIEDRLEAVPSALERTQEGIRNVSHIVAAMKERAHPGKGSKASTDINHLIDTALTVSRNSHKTVAKVETDLGEIQNVLTYKNELCQVLINLVVNAAHAIEEAKKSRSVDGLIRVSTRQHEDEVEIRVSDNGCGIPASVVEKIFDPFFTTKGVGHGTGQGLAIARTTIVEMHRGELDVESEVGTGTDFIIRLPLKDPESPVDKEDQEVSV